LHFSCFLPHPCARDFHCIFCHSRSRVIEHFLMNLCQYIISKIKKFMFSEGFISSLRPENILSLSRFSAKFQLCSQRLRKFWEFGDQFKRISTAGTMMTSWDSCSSCNVSFCEMTLYWHHTAVRLCSWHQLSPSFSETLIFTRHNTLHKSWDTIADIAIATR